MLIKSREETSMKNINFNESMHNYQVQMHPETVTKSNTIWEIADKC